MSAALHLYDRLSDRTGAFQPAGETVKMYVCGITPYDATHLGHAFTFVSFDVLIRYLRFLGYGVRYVQNVTDIDDPLFEKARRLGVPYEDLAAGETAQYQKDMRDLNVLPPQAFPHASQEIEGMIALVQDLFDRGHAYAVDGHVYFSVASDGEYGTLSRYDREEMIALARQRGGDPDDPRKRDPLDFVLWRPAQSDEPEVASPWGRGLPGWHLECSTMALKYLGMPLDIHGGGADLIFPHHENEIAQSEGATGEEPFVRFWMHTGMVYMDGEKMSKSLGNMVFVRDLVPEYGANALRLYISGHHYRAELHWDPAALEEAGRLASYVQEAVSLASAEGGEPLDPSPYRERFIARMNDDLDTPAAIAVLKDLAAAIHEARAKGMNVAAAQAQVRELGEVLGLVFAA